MAARACAKITISNKKENADSIKIEQKKEIRIRKKGDSPFDEISLVKFNGQKPAFNWIGNNNLEIIFSQSVNESTTSYNELTIRVLRK